MITSIILIILLTDEEIKILNNILQNNNLYLSGLNKFNIAVNKSGNYIPQNKIRYYYRNQEITQLFKPRIKLYNKISETNKPYNKLYCFFIMFAPQRR